jgi:glycine/D-amino acid oxidase-like deaminating enzyme
VVRSDEATRDPEQQASLWMATATAAPPCGPLAGDVDADVCVIGAGYAGLSCALALADQRTDVVVLEAHGIGHGGAGRNGGQVIPGLKHDPDELVRMFDAATAERMIALCGGAAERTFALIAKHAIGCDARPGGWVQPAHSRAALGTVQRRADQWRRRGAPVELLDRAQTAAALGTPYYHGAWIDRRAGSVQPLSYVRGLARAALAHGAKAFVDSPALSARRDAGRWIVATPRGGVRARAVVVATDAYSRALVPDVQRNFFGLNSVQIATDVLPAHVRAQVLPCELPVSETRKLVYYYRLSPDGRFVMGGRGNVEGRVPEHVFASLRTVAERLFPALAGIGWPYRWWGQVGFTLDWMPHLAEIAPGMWSASGYCGRGVAMATTMGDVLADRALGGTLARADPSLAFPARPLKRIPLWRLRKPGVGAAILWFRLRETLGVPA